MGKPYGISGTPWHITTGDRKKDERRDKRKCEHFRQSDGLCCCRNYQNGYSGCKCGGASQCNFYNENKKQRVEKRTNMSEKLFTITLVAGSIMMICLVLMLIIPCYVTLAFYSVSTLTTITTGLLSNIANKDHALNNNKFIE